MGNLHSGTDSIRYEQGVYDAAILKYYTEEEFEELNSYIDHDRDLKFTYAGLRQVYDKYLCQDRSTGIIYETPQFMYMLIAATIFHGYDKERPYGLCETLLRRRIPSHD